ncbi:MAG: metallopeptidase family protein [Candidatus Pacebacteria bacterium]|nr:metallopeptidase family protein [Candidatus Paceibacterota bacterium]
MESEIFEKLVLEAYEKLPEWARNKVDNVALMIEEEPSEEIRMQHGLAHDETLLGHYQGIPLTMRGEGYGGMVMPDTITIFREPILDAADEDCPLEASDDEYLERVRKVVDETVWHEYAHYLGMDEEEVRNREHIRDHK